MPPCTCFSTRLRACASGFPRRDRAGKSRRKCGVDQFAEVMNQKQMCFLRRRAALAGHDQLARGETFGLAAAAAEKRDAFDPELFRLVQCSDDVSRVAARG